MNRMKMKWNRRKKTILLIISICLCLAFIVINIRDEKDEIENPTYRTPLNEIKEKIEYIYSYEKIVKGISDDDFGNIGALPEKKSVKISVFILDGNKLLFLPKEKENIEIILGGMSCGVHYSKEREGYLFYLIKDWELEESGVPVNTWESCSIKYCTVKKINNELEGGAEHIQNHERNYEGEYNLDNLAKLGEIEVDFTEENSMRFSSDMMGNNEYIDVVVKYISSVLKEKRKYGNYYVYVGEYGRMADRYGGTTSGYITAAIIGEGIREYAAFDITDNGNVDVDGVWLINAPTLADAPTYFSNNLHEEDLEYLISGIMKMQRQVIQIEVSAESDEDAVDEKWSENHLEDGIKTDFRSMNPEKAAEWIAYVCSYCEWFGMNELGYKEGEIQEFNGKEIIMYTWNNSGNTLLFVPKDMVNMVIIGKEGTEYPIYVNSEGNAEFYCIENNPYAEQTGQMKTTLVTTYDAGSHVYLADYLTKLGEARLEINRLPFLGLPEVEEDEYVLALREHISELLKQNERKGSYSMYIGEYEAMHTNKVCISAAIIGKEDEYYVRYMIVKSGDGNYYFWPAGFGINIGLEGCETEKYEMNKICCERVKQLRRKEIFVL